MRRLRQRRRAMRRRPGSPLLAAPHRPPSPPLPHPQLIDQRVVVQPALLPLLRSQTTRQATLGRWYLDRTGRRRINSSSRRVKRQGPLGGGVQARPPILPPRKRTLRRDQNRRAGLRSGGRGVAARRALAVAPRSAARMVRRPGQRKGGGARTARPLATARATRPATRPARAIRLAQTRRRRLTRRLRARVDLRLRLADGRSTLGLVHRHHPPLARRPLRAILPIFRRSMEPQWQRRREVGQQQQQEPLLGKGQPRRQHPCLLLAAAARAAERRRHRHARAAGAAAAAKQPPLLLPSRRPRRLHHPPPPRHQCHGLNG